MALYKRSGYILQSEDEIFDEEHRAGKIATRTGIYRCSGCGREIAAAQKQPLPPQDHHEHTQRQGAIRWTLIVYADHRPKITHGPDAAR
jgi:DNA-directed RNA polymerase subunit RPC12/RpoP